MNNRVKGILLGFLASLAGVALWIFLYVVVGFVAGISGGVMAFLFIFVYRKFNPDDYSKQIYILAGVATLIGIVAGELISLAIIANQYGLTFSQVITDSEVLSGTFIDIGMGVVFTALVFFYVVRGDLQKKKRLEAQKEAESFSDAVDVEGVESDDNPDNFYIESKVEEVKCPNCGASYTSDNNSCPYCKGE